MQAATADGYSTRSLRKRCLIATLVLHAPYREACHSGSRRVYSETLIERGYQLAARAATGGPQDALGRQRQRSGVNPPTKRWGTARESSHQLAQPESPLGKSRPARAMASRIDGPLVQTLCRRAGRLRDVPIRVVQGRCGGGGAMDCSSRTSTVAGASRWNVATVRPCHRSRGVSQKQILYGRPVVSTL